MQKGNGLGASGAQPAILHVGSTGTHWIAYRLSCGAGLTGDWPKTRPLAPPRTFNLRPKLLVACCTQEDIRMRARITGLRRRASPKTFEPSV
jgi:hypothetical protein